MSSGLFGIINSNRTEDDHWGKNCFNSSFPTSMACYMLEKNIKAIYVKLEIVNGKPTVVSDEIPISEVFNCGNLHPKDLYFSFESVYEPYSAYTIDGIDGIDLVVKENSNQKFLSPLEVKLTVLPTDSTSKRKEEFWGCELVIRSATTSYCALGMFDSVSKSAQDVRDIFEDTCSSIQMWDNEFEMYHSMPSLCACINNFQKNYYLYQKPLVMQVLWKTQGKSPSLAEQAFDIVIWSDYAFSRLFIDSSNPNPEPLKASKTPEKKNQSSSTAKTTSLKTKNKKKETMTRPMRATARLSRCLWELSKSGKIHVRDIYRQMAFGNQTDKEFAINGSKWRKYISSPRIQAPILPKSAAREIIEDGYINKLSPERRFDQTLYFTFRNENENK